MPWVPVHVPPVAPAAEKVVWASDAKDLRGSKEEKAEGKGKLEKRDKVWIYFLVFFSVRLFTTVVPRSAMLLRAMFRSTKF